MELDKLAPAVVALQASLSPVDKSANNPFFKSRYAPLPEVRAALQPLLAANKLALLTFPTVIDGRNGLHFYLIHESGQYLDGQWFLTPAKSDPQGEGADTTYKRRFGEMAITGLVADEDDDGNRASQPPLKNAGPAPQLVGKRPTQPQKPKTEADVKRDQLRDIAKHQGWDLKKVASLYAEKVNGGGGNLATATAEDIEAFITSLEAGVLTIE